MRKESVEQLVEEMVLPLLAETTLELVDVEYVRERDWYLRVFLTKTGGLEIDDCQAISERLAVLLDEKDFIKERYYLEVSSPGLDRVLRKDRDLIRHKGDKVEVKTKEEKKAAVGVLGDFTEETLQLTVSGEHKSIERKNIISVRLYLEF